MVVIFHGISATDWLSDSVYPKKYYGRLDHAPDTIETVPSNPFLSNCTVRTV